MANNNWYILTVKPGAEFKSRDSLTRVGIPILVPMQYRRVQRRSGAPQMRAYPLFSRYLFAQMDRALWARAIELRHASGGRVVTSVLGCQNIPHTLSRSELTEVTRLAARPAEIPAEPQLRIGDTVTIIDGPYTGSTAVIRKRRQGDDTALVLRGMVQMFGSLREVTIDVSERLVRVVA